MKNIKFVIIAIIIILSIALIAFDESKKTQNATVPKGYKLIWSEEFDKDLSNWSIITEDAKNAPVHNGSVLLTAFYKSSGDYISRSLIESKFSFKYGIIEFRGRLSYVPGVDNELWLMPTSGEHSPEIDVLERPGRYAWCVNSIMYGDNVWDTNFDDVTGKTCKNTNDGNYHIYALKWEPDVIIWYIDGVERWRAKEQWVSNANVPMKIDMGLCADKDKGCYIGNFGDNVDNFDLLPTDFAIDYIRIYQKLPKFELPD